MLPPLRTRATHTLHDDKSFVTKTECKSVLSLLQKLNKNYNNLLQMFVNDIAQRNMINKAMDRDYGDTDRLSSSSNSKQTKQSTIADLLARSERESASFETMFENTRGEQKEEDTKPYIDDTRRARGFNVRDYRDYRQSRKRSRSRSRSKSREYRNSMATIELSISSEDFYL